MAAPSTRQTHIDYCLRRLGDPVIEINVDDDQLEDRVDESLEYFREYHSEALQRTFLKHLVTATDVTNEFITIDSAITQVTKLFSIQTGTSTTNFFDIKYQMMLNDMTDIHGTMGNLAYYDMMQQYLGTIDMMLNGTPQTTFVRKQNRLYIHGDFADGDIVAGKYLVAEVYKEINDSDYTTVWNDLWLKEYTTALFKQQWGQNLIKFDGMVLPGGVTLNGRQIYDDASQDILALRERIRLEHEMPADFFIG
mgnify:FL=1|jgi:hypothetical protein|tara:strand:- start:897 stop:1649 length:753 start_codon:yes stop_codon:yes gene_type:complete